MSLNHGAIWWSELMTRDVPGALKYYRDVCGWAFDAMPAEGSDYHVAIVHGKPVAGIMDMTGQAQFDEMPSHWITYIAVDDVDRAMETTRFAGGTVIRAPLDVPGVGRIATVGDASGAVVGLMTPVFPGDELVQQEAFDADESEDDEENFPV
ncbi:VOC family protein [Tropicimonas marinistellae]|uniref:VOC family protein n=1 Tax=Tropicimonas marinistellae TaxID=1739787 RepID=UPI00191A3FC9|nr:VOC family protein [Tropicimonas marinistellae]